MTPLNNSDRLDDLFRNNLKNIRKEPEPKNWAKIKGQLNATNRAPLTTYAEGLALFSLLGLLLFYMLNTPGGKNVNQPLASSSTSSPTAQAPHYFKPETQAKKDHHFSAPKVGLQNQNASTSHGSMNGELGKSNHEQFPELTSINKKANLATSASSLINSVRESTSATTPAHIQPAPEFLAFLEGRPTNIGKKEKQNGMFPADETKKEGCGPGFFYTGLTYTFNNSWIFNQNTYNEFGGSELDYKINFGSSYGLLAGYEWTDKMGIEFRVNLNSLQGQKYADKLHSGEVSREVRLSYSTFPLVFKKCGPTLSFLPGKVWINYLAGASYDRLRYAQLSLNDKTEDITNRFNSNNVSFILGLESCMTLNHKFFLSFGIRGSCSTNINGKDYPIVNNDLPVLGTWNYSNNILVGASLGLNYKLGK